MRGFSPALLALILGQVCLHSSMAGVRVAAPLLMLRQEYPAWAVGLLLGLFAAAPVTTSTMAMTARARRSNAALPGTPGEAPTVRSER